MTAKEMALAYWGYGKDYDHNNLSGDLRETLIATINLMHEWEAQQLKKIKADAAVYELLIASREQMIVSRDREIEDLKESNAQLAEEIEEAIRLKKQWAKKAMEAASEIIDLRDEIRRINNL